jgi:hypothetical protein
MADVFFPYSRYESAFVEHVVDALQAHDTFLGQ